MQWEREVREREFLVLQQQVEALRLEQEDRELERAMGSSMDQVQDHQEDLDQQFELDTHALRMKMLNMQKRDLEQRREQARNEHNYRVNMVLGVDLHVSKSSRTGPQLAYWQELSGRPAGAASSAHAVHGGSICEWIDGCKSPLGDLNKPNGGRSETSTERPGSKGKGRPPIPRGPDGKPLG